MQIDKQTLQTETIKQLEKAITEGKITRKQASDPAFVGKVIQSAVQQIHTKAALRPNRRGGPSPVPIRSIPDDGYEYIEWDNRDFTICNHRGGPQASAPKPRSLFEYVGFATDYPSEVQMIDLLRDGWEQWGMSGTRIFFRRPLDLTQQEAAQQEARKQHVLDI